MTEEKNIKQFAKAFIAAQTEMLNASKDGFNPHYKSKYADLTSIREACVPALNKNGIGVMQPIVQVENKQYIKTILLHESGEEMSCLTEIMNVQNTPQAHGSGITYARRYGLQSIACIAAEDDDGNAASQGETDRQKLAKSATAAQNEIFKEQADKDFKAIKEALEKAGSSSEIDTLCEAYKSILNKFRTNDKVRFAILKKTKDQMLLDLQDHEKDDSEFPM
jgi:hypothetical protein